MNIAWSPENFMSAPTLRLMDGGSSRSPSMTATGICRYRGYEIVPKRQWASWCVGIYATRADLPLMSRSTLRTLAARKEDAVSEAKDSIDRVLGLRA
jgi:hypothetical protein